MAALRQQIESTERSKATAARSRSRRRIVSGAITTAILIASGISLARFNPLDLIESETAEESSRSTLNLDTVIETGAIRVAMPNGTVAESLEFPEFDDTAGTAWTLATDDLYLSLVLTEFSFQLNQDAADGAFDAAIGGMARRGDGTVLENDSISTGDPILGRRVVIEVDGAQLYTEMYANDRWVVQLLSGGEFSTPPAEYTAMLDSFAWRL